MDETVPERRNLTPNTATNDIAIVAEFPPQGTGFGDVRLSKARTRL